MSQNVMEFRKQAVLNQLKVAIANLKEARKALHQALIQILTLGSQGDDIANEVIEQLADLAATDPPLDNETLKTISKRLCERCKTMDYEKCKNCEVHLFVNTKAQDQAFLQRKTSWGVLA